MLKQEFRSALNVSGRQLCKAKYSLASTVRARDAADAAIVAAISANGSAPDGLYDAYDKACDEWYEAQQDVRRLEMLTDLGLSAL